MQSTIKSLGNLTANYKTCERIHIIVHEAMRLREKGIFSVKVSLNAIKADTSGWIYLRTAFFTCPRHLNIAPGA